MSDALSRIQGIDKGLLSDQIYMMIRGMIRDSSLKPGEQLVESRLARQLNVSQSPVREALKRLTHDGLVQQVRHLGSFVAEYSPDDGAQARVARIALEELAGRLACGQLDSATRAALTSLIEEMARCAQTNDLTSFREFDFAFHRAVIVASKNSYLPRMWDVIEPSLRALHGLSDPDYPGDWHRVARAHGDLLGVLDSGEPESAATLFRRHAAGDLHLQDHADAFPASGA